jgi:hypothetical protein
MGKTPTCGAKDDQCISMSFILLNIFRSTVEDQLDGLTQPGHPTPRLLAYPLIAQPRKMAFYS